MNMIRRAFGKAVLAGAVLASVPLTASVAQAAPQAHRVDVVKIMAFSCPVCRAAEAQDKVIEQAVKAKGGSFVWAPLPADESETGAKERVYYGSRSLKPGLAEEVKQALYKGMQDLAIPLGQEPQVYVWFQQQFSTLSDDEFNELFVAARSDAARAALGRAASLAARMGVDSVPSYIVVVDGRPVVALDPSSVTGGSLSALRDEVINRVNSSSK